MWGENGEQFKENDAFPTGFRPFDVAKKFLIKKYVYVLALVWNYVYLGEQFDFYSTVTSNLFGRQNMNIYTHSRNNRLELYQLIFLVTITEFSATSKKLQKINKCYPTNILVPVIISVFSISGRNLPSE